MNIGPAIGIAIGIAIGVAINALMGRKAKKAAAKLSDGDKSQLGKRFTVRQPRGRLGASIFLVILFCGGALSLVIFCFDQIIEFYSSAETLWDAVWPTLLMCGLFSPLILLAIWCLLRAVVWKVQVDGERIVYTSFIGKKTEFSFTDITEVKPYRTQTGQAIKVYVKCKKAFAADPACENYFLLSSRLAEREGGVRDATVDNILSGELI